MQDWRSHKEYCRKVKAAGANTFDAILFAANETKPRLVKIPWELIPGDSKDEPGRYHKLDKDRWFQQPESDVRFIYFNRWGINGPGLGRGLCFMYDENFMINGSPFNRCIVDLVVDVTGGRAGHEWCGNVLGLRMKGESYDFFENVDMEEDLKPFVTYFEEYGKEIPASTGKLGFLNRRLFLMFFSFLGSILFFPYTYGSSHLLRATFSFFFSLTLMYLFLMYLL